MGNYSNTEARRFLERHRLSPTTSAEVGPTPGLWMMKALFVHVWLVNLERITPARFFISHKSHFNLIDNGWRELNFTCKGTHPDFGSMSMKSCWCVRGTNFTQVPLSTFSIALCISLDSMSAVHLKIWAEQTGRILTICEHSLITFLWILKVFYFMY